MTKLLIGYTFLRYTAQVEHLSKAVQEAFPTNKDLIVDAEMLLVDTKTGKPLPFGTLGIHKKKEFADATVCLFIFDCLYYDGVSLIDRYHLPFFINCFALQIF